MKEEDDGEDFIFMTKRIERGVAMLGLVVKGKGLSIVTSFSNGIGSSNQHEK